ncbi:hypothetical protein [Sphingorhabdus sp.]|jgi:hypothetical protein|uniref:hypothetical protein n=1 Tax=Sphingorhabdus sp. TaxID=1902408 RepID=UPI0037C698EF
MSWLTKNDGEVQFPKKTNILSSLVWLSAITFPSGSISSAFAPWPQSLMLFAVGSLPVLAAIWYYRHWTKEDPNRLQTEDFRIQLQAIAKISSSDGREIIIDQSAALFENPMLGSVPMIEEGRSE